MEVNKLTVAILISTYNGGKYIKEQLESIYNQTYKNIEIIVRDDGSTDNTIEILKEEEKKGKLKLYTGDNLGVAKSFWDLIVKSNTADYHAFCDQDDYWEENKIERAVYIINQQDNKKPVLYTSNVKVVDNNLKLIKDGKCKEQYIASFKRSLVKSMSPGCTFVFNNHSREVMLKFPSNYLDIHDWAAHKIISATGTVIRDSESTMLYRQHDSNVIGASIGFMPTISRAISIYKNKKTPRYVFANYMKEIYYEELSENNRKSIDILVNYRSSKKNKKIFYKYYKNEFGFLSKIYFKFLINREKI